MCGRTACTLGKNSIICACRYPTTNGDTALPIWKDINLNNEYNPSFNMSPGRFMPVLIKASHLEDISGEERALCPMKWGLIPSWYHGEAAKFDFKTVNCQAENIQRRKSYQGALQKGRRCVVLADGFFEWKKESNGKKQPYFIYSSQSKIYEMKSRKWTPEEQLHWCSDEEWRGPDLLRMAGLFDIWKSETGELLYSYTVITVESSSELSWLHHRMPAILKAEDVGIWLDGDTIPSKEAVQLLRPSSDIQWYSVSTVVNNTRNQVIDCVVPLTVKNPVESAGSKFLTNWLKTAKQMKSEDSAEEPPKKNMKLD